MTKSIDEDIEGLRLAGELGELAGLPEPSSSEGSHDGSHSGEAKPMYPKPDRSNHHPNLSKTAENDTLDIGWAEGVFSDGRPFRIECWAQDQVTYLQCFFSSVGLEELDRSELQQFLERERLIRFVSDKRFASGRLTSDASENSMWEVNVVIGDEDELYAESDVSLKPYPSEGSEGVPHGGR